MRNSRSKAKRLVLIGLIAVALIPVATLAIPGPLRALAPGLFGLVCEDRVCVDDARRLAEAQELVRSARADVAQKLGAPHALPLALFCSSEQCFITFGERRSTAETFGGKAILIGPRGWAAHFVRHELIHAAQYEKLGFIRAWRGPQWITEGMAYSLSEDPRRPLPARLEAWRAQYERRLGAEEGAALWARVEALYSSGEARIEWKH
jgi:hypothetical protein